MPGRYGPVGNEQYDTKQSAPDGAVSFWDWLWNYPKTLSTAQQDSSSFGTGAASKPKSGISSTASGPGAGANVALLPLPGQTPSGFDLNNAQSAAVMAKYYNYAIWTGQETPTRAYGPGGGKSQLDTGTHPTPTLASDYIKQWQRADPAAVMALQQRLLAAGLMPKSDRADGFWSDDTQNALSIAMQQSALHPDDPSQTVDHYIDGKIKYNQSQGADTSYTKAVVNLTNPEQAKGLLYQTLQQYLGRMPTDADVKAFTGALNTQEKKHPQEITYERDPVTNFPVSKGTSGGYDAGTAAIDYARAQPGSAEYQAATSYMDAFAAALKG